MSTLADEISELATQPPTGECCKPFDVDVRGMPDHESRKHIQAAEAHRGQHARELMRDAALLRAARLEVC
jgi:hypothetical protein